MPKSKYRREDKSLMFLKDKGLNVFNDPDQLHYVRSLEASHREVATVWNNSRAGTGKTELAIMMGYQLLETEIYSKIVYIRSAVAVRNSGFLPGTDKDKAAPYMQVALDAFDSIHTGLGQKLIESGKLECHTTEFLRGKTIDDAFVIFDEAQNYDLIELRTALTRLGKNSKGVIIGCSEQNDNPRNKRHGLTPFELYMLHFIDEPAAFCKLHKVYRGRVAEHADNVDKTLELLEQGVLDPKAVVFPYNTTEFKEVL